MEQRDSLGWAKVDATGDAGSFVKYLDAATANGQAYKRRTYELVGASPGRRILDLGCGAGDDAIAMARQVGSWGEAVGVDKSEAMVNEARRRATGQGLPVRFEVGDAMALPFADNSFDGCRADRVFQHLADPERALAELVRVARPGAPIVIADMDHGSTMVDMDDRHLARKVKVYVSDLIANPWAGRRLPGMFRAAGLTDVRVMAEFWRHDLEGLKRSVPLADILRRMAAERVITAAEAEAVMTELESREAEGRFFMGAAFFVVVGNKAS